MFFEGTVSERHFGYDLLMPHHIFFLFSLFLYQIPGKKYVSRIKNTEGTLMLEKAFRYLKSHTQKITHAFMIFNSIDMPLNSKFNGGT